MEYGKTIRTSQAAVGLSKLAQVMRQHAWEQTGPQGLNPTQGQLLTTLLASREPGLTLKELGERLAVSQPTVSDSIQSLVKKGLVEKRPSPTDRRATIVSLTDAGRVLAEGITLWPDFLVEALETLTGAERDAFTRSIVKMIRSLQEAGRIPVSRMCVTCRFFRPHVYDDPGRPHHCMFVNAAFGDAELRTECGEHETAAEGSRNVLWTSFSHRQPIPVGFTIEPQIQGENR